MSLWSLDMPHAKDFIHAACQGFVEGLKLQLSGFKETHRNRADCDDSWRNSSFDVFLPSSRIYLFTYFHIPSFL